MTEMSQMTKRHPTAPIAQTYIYKILSQKKLENRRECLKGEKNSRQSGAKITIVHNKIERVQFAPDLRICQKQKTQDVSA
jgi:hypothetical protein